MLRGQYESLWNREKINLNIFITFLGGLGIFIEEEVIFGEFFLSVCRLSCDALFEASRL
jgi:hypothetical protein